MSDQEIIEGNKLIAEFMGGKYDKDTLFPIHPDDLWLPIHGIVNYTTIEIGKGKILLYYKSWDWFMPVIQKIFTIKFDDVKGLREYSDQLNTIFDGYSYNLSSEITEVWLAVVEFIKWYNENYKKH